MKHIYLSILILLFGLSGECSLEAQTVDDIDISTSVSNNNSDIRIYPNPATEKFSLTIPYSEINYISINNIIGKEIKKVKATPDNFYDIRELRRGIYIIRVFNRSDELIKALRLSKA